MHDEGAIEANLETLLRCTQVDDCLVLCLWSGKAIDEATKSRLEAEPSMHHRCVYLYEWLKQRSQSDAYLQFLRIMDNNDQRHVTNLLKNSLEGVDVPLSLDRWTRLRVLTPDLLFLIYLDEEFVSLLQTTKGALTAVDCEELRMPDRTQSRKIAQLVNAVLRRSNHSFDRLREALVRTKQQHIADALVQGQIVRVHLETSRSELDVELSRAMNGSRDQFGCSALLDGLHSLGIHFVRCRPDHSILVYFYCKTPQQMIQFTQQVDSDELTIKMTDALNSLLKTIRPKEKRSLEVKLRLEDEDVTRVREFTGLENWTGVQTRSTSDRRQKPPFTALDSATQRPEATEVTRTEKKQRKTNGQTQKGSPPLKSSSAEAASVDFEFLTADIECLRLEAKVHQLEEELKRKETEWKTEKQKLNDKIKEAEEKQESQNLQLKTRFENDLLNRLNGSRNNGKCRDESEKQTEFYRTV